MVGYPKARLWVEAKGADDVLAWLIEGPRLLAQVRDAAVQLPRFPLWVLLLYYVAVVAGGCGRGGGRL